MNDGDMQKNTEEVPFVPYVAEAFAGDDDKRKKKRILFIPLIIAVVLGLIYLIMTVQKKNNFYQKTLADLSFDYRNGETVLDDDDSIKPGALASEISESIQIMLLRIE